MYSVSDETTAAVGYLPKRGNKVVLRHFHKYSKYKHTQSRPIMFVFILHNAELHHLPTVTYHILLQEVGKLRKEGGDGRSITPPQPLQGNATNRRVHLAYTMQ